MSQPPTITNIKKGEGILTPLRLVLLCCFLLTIVTMISMRPQAPSSLLRRSRRFFAEPESSTDQQSSIKEEYGLTEEVSTEISQSVGDDKGVIYTQATEAATEVANKPWFMKGGGQRPDRHDLHSKLFPEDAPGEDRIINQLMYTLPKDENVTIKKILLFNGLGAWGVQSDPLGRVWFLDNKCPVDQCSFTGDQEEAPNVDAILFKYHFGRNIMPFPRRPEQVWIIYYLESPANTISVALPYKDVFNWTATYRRDADIVTPYEKWVYYARDPLITGKEHHRNYAANKTKKVAWFVSNCNPKNNRGSYASQLSKYIQVDVYGRCGKNICLISDHENCLRMLDRDYKFYLSFENSNCQDYASEKFFVNGLFHDVIPIVMGARASDYALLAPPHSYIHVADYNSIQDLAKYLHQLDQNDTLYNSYFKWKGTGEFINTYFFCRVCAMLHASERRNRHYNYEDINKWNWENKCNGQNWKW